MSSWDDVGGNPSPGDVGALRERARGLQSVCDHGRDLESRLRDLHAGLGAEWVGEGAQGMSAAVQQNLPDLVGMWSSHRDAARTLDSYAARLEDLQSRAGHALRDYSRAAADRQSAEREHDDASGRHGAASGEVRRQEAALVSLRARRLVALATHQPASAVDHEIGSAEAAHHHQDALAQEAARDLEVASGRVDDADDRMTAARGRIADLRDEAESQARSTADAILAAIGIVNSHNPLVRFADDAIRGGGSALTWFSDNALDAFDDAITVLSLAMLCLPFTAPVLGPVLIGLSVISLIGHAYRYLNGEEDAAHMAMSVIGVLPFGRVLKVMSKTKVSPEEIEKFPGLVKRGLYTEDARKAKGVLHRVHAVPQRKQGPEWLYEYAIAGAMAKKGVEAKDRVQLGIDLVRMGVQPAAPEDRAVAIPATTVVLQPQGVAP